MKIAKFFSNLKGLFSETEEEPVATKPNNIWHLTVKGEITNLDRTDIDKSGRNPKYLIYGTLHLDTYELDGADFEIPEVFNFKGKELDFNRKYNSVLSVGEVVELKFTGIEKPTGRFII